MCLFGSKISSGQLNRMFSHIFVRTYFYYNKLFFIVGCIIEILYMEIVKSRGPYLI